MAASSRRWRGFTPEFGGGIRLLALAASDNGDTRSIRWRARLSHMLSADSPQTAEKPSPEHRESGHRITPMAACERRARPCCGGIPSCLGPASQVYALRIGAFATANGNFAPSANDRKVPHRRHCLAKNAAPTTNDRTGEAALHGSAPPTPIGSRGPPLPDGPAGQISTASEIARASSSSTPR